MPAPYSYDLRVADRVFNVSRNTIYQWRKRQGATGDFKAETGYQHGWGQKITHLEQFRQFSLAHAEQTLA